MYLNEKSDETSDESCHSIVYKYRSWKDDYHVKALRCKEVFFAPPKKLNDPFDSVLQNNWKALSKDEILDRVKTRMDLFFPDASKKEKEERLLYVENHVTPSELEKSHYRVGQIYRDRFYGIFALSNDGLNNLMWSHYSSSHEGFCIGYDFHTLRDHLENALTESYLIAPYEVEYVAEASIDPRELDDVEKMDKTLSTKALCWAYEKELRFVLLSRQGQTLKTDDRTMRIPEKCISEVLLGWKMAPSEKDQIKKVLRGYAKKPLLYSIRPIPERFALTKKQIYY